VLVWTADYFRTKGIETARLDAEVLLAHCLGVDRLHLYLNLERPLALEERKQYRGLVRRRGLREPVAYITGHREFWSTRFRTVPGVLIPRPETEHLVDAVIREISAREAPRVLEIGTGSGAVAVSVAQEVPNAFVVATDINPAVIATARANGLDAGVADTVCFVASDLFTAIRPSEDFDVICSNPPYIDTGLIRHLDPEVREFEPMLALDGGPDGLDVIRALVRHVMDHLKPGACFMTEIGEGQEAAVRELFAVIGGLRDIRTVRDLASIPRVILGRK
jgi:release factor glutamine methyltransferase